MLEWIAISFSRDLPDPGIEPGFPALQADALPSEPPWKCAVLKSWFEALTLKVTIFGDRTFKEITKVK